MWACQRACGPLLPTGRRGRRRVDGSTDLGQRAHDAGRLLAAEALALEPFDQRLGVEVEGRPRGRVAEGPLLLLLLGAADAPEEEVEARRHGRSGGRAAMAGTEGKEGGGGGLAGHRAPRES